MKKQKEILLQYKVHICTRIESGSDDPDNIGHLFHFLVGQVGLIHKVNYLDVTWI